MFHLAGLGAFQEAPIEIRNCHDWNGRFCRLPPNWPETLPARSKNYFGHSLGGNWGALALDDTKKIKRGNSARQGQSEIFLKLFQHIMFIGDRLITIEKNSKAD